MSAFLIKDDRGYLMEWGTCGPIFTWDATKARDFCTRARAARVVDRNRAALQRPQLVHQWLLTA